MNRLGDSGASELAAIGAGLEEKLFHFCFRDSGSMFIVLFLLIKIRYSRMSILSLNRNYILLGKSVLCICIGQRSIMYLNQM